MGPAEKIYDSVIFEKMQRLFETSSPLSSHKLERLLEEEGFRQSHSLLFETLTHREREILKWIALGETNQQISEKLFVSSDTVRTHRNRIWQKLEIKNLVGAIRYAQAFDLV